MHRLTICEILLIFLAILPLSSANIIITEVMYNPIPSDTYNEWVEIYNNGSTMDLTNYKLCSNTILPGYIDHLDMQTYKNTGMSLIQNTYAIITDGGSGTDTYNNFNISENSTAFHTSASYICGGLSNSGETITLYDNNSEQVINLTYTDITEQGYSLALINNIWNQSQSLNGTPGYANFIQNTSINITNTTITQTNNTSNQTNTTNQNITSSIKGLKITAYLEDELYTGITYTSLFKIENLDHVTGQTDNINLTINYNITKDFQTIKKETINITSLNSYKTANTGEFTPNQTGTLKLCGKIISSTVDDVNKTDDISCKNISIIDTSSVPCNISLNITTEKLIYNTTEKVNFYNNLNNESFPFTIEYWIEDLFSNIVKSRYNTSNTNKKSWTPKLEEQDRIFLIRSRLASISCNDSSLTDNKAEKLFAVKNLETSSETSQNPNSSLNIISIKTGSDNKVKFGEAVDVKINIYKGDTASYSTSLWIEDPEKISAKAAKIHTFTKFTNYTFTIPIQLRPNCDEDYKDTTYHVKVKGLGKTDSKELKVEGITSSLCEETTSDTTSTNKKDKFSYQITSLPYEVKTNEEFITKLKISSDDEDHIVKVWSYVYRGSKSYSGERQENIQSITLPAHSSATIALKNTILEAETGDYKFKIKINKDSQKTNKELTSDLKVKNPTITAQIAEQTKNQPKEPIETQNMPDFSKIELIYESPQEKSKRLIYWFFLLLSVFLNILFIWRK